jgi:hypothetical protein
MLTKTGPVAAALLAGVALLAGCGSGSGESAKSGAQIVKDAQQATASAPSVHVTGSAASTAAPLKLDVVAGQGRGGGTITSGTNTVDLILANKTVVYLKTSDAAFLASLVGSAATARGDVNRWLQSASTNRTLTGLGQLLDITRLPQSMYFTGVPTKQHTTTFAGVSVIPVIDPKGGGTLYVAASGKPYIIGIKGAPKSGGATLTFDHYGVAQVPPPPPNPLVLPG